MKKRTEIIYIVLIIIIIAAIIGLVIVKIVDNEIKKEEGNVNITENEPGVFLPSEATLNTFEYKVKTLLDSTNYVNSIFSSNEYDEENSYINEKTGLTCKKYNGENSDIIINVLKTINENPFSENGYFQNKEREDGEDLFVCLPTNCTVTAYEINEFEVTKNKSETEKEVKILDKEYTVQKHDEIWQFSSPLVNCVKSE